MRLISLLFATLLAAWGAAPRPALGVDLALVLLNDVSKSMDNGEYAMVKAGYRSAFSDPEVIAALVGNGGGVAVTYIEFSGQQEVVQVMGWSVLSDAASARVFGEALAMAPRTGAGDTALHAGLAESTRLLTEADFGAARRVIDVASDHPHDGGRAAAMRDAAVAAGITINALPIIDERPIGTIDGHLSYTFTRWGTGTMTDFYIRDIIGGPGSFVVEARDYAAFGEALKRKLLLELIATREHRRPERPAAIVSAGLAGGQ